MPLELNPLANCLPASRCYIIAEAGVNHNGRLDLALKLVEAAHQAGADAVKFQWFSPHALSSPLAPLGDYQQQSGVTSSQTELLANLALSETDFKALATHCRQLGIQFLCTPFDEQAARCLVQDFRVPFLKVSSGDLTALPLLQRFARLNVPLVLSTGMATLAEVMDAVNTLRDSTPFRRLGDGLALLHCVSAYPAPLEAVNLRALQTLQETFPSLVVGYSDHTRGVQVAPLAVALGARLIEKHLTLDATLPGPDHAASLEPHQFAELVSTIRQTELVLGHGVKQPHPSEENCRTVARRSLALTRDVEAGQRLTEADLICLRPATGLSPRLWEQLIGQPVPHRLAAGTLLQASHFQPTLLTDSVQERLSPVR